MLMLRVINKALSLVSPGGSALDGGFAEVVQIERARNEIRFNLDDHYLPPYGPWCLCLNLERDAKPCIAWALENEMVENRTLTADVVIGGERVTAEFCIMQHHENTAAEGGTTSTFSLREVVRAVLG